LSSLAVRKFHEELASLVSKNVTVITDTGKSYTGSLVGYNPDNLNICLDSAVDDSGKRVQKLFLNGSKVAQIFTTEKGFNLRGLADRLEKVFPRLVRLYEEENVIVVMNKIRLNERGIIEGTGPAAERVQRVYEEFMKEQAR
jgi:small nuclear ribonucleoprotein (snRNP)-like protein